LLGELISSLSPVFEFFPIVFSSFVAFFDVPNNGTEIFFFPLGQLTGILTVFLIGFPSINGLFHLSPLLLVSFFNFYSSQSIDTYIPAS